MPSWSSEEFSTIVKTEVFASNKLQINNILQVNKTTSGQLTTSSDIEYETTILRPDIEDDCNFPSMGEKHTDDQDIFALTEFVELESIGDEQLFIIDETCNLKRMT